MTQPGWKNTIAISGAGSGFGAALAHKYAADGWKVAITDIDEDRAKELIMTAREPWFADEDKTKANG